MMNNHYVPELRQLVRIENCPGNVGLCDLCNVRLLHTVRAYLNIAIPEKGKPDGK